MSHQKEKRGSAWSCEANEKISPALPFEMTEREKVCNKIPCISTTLKGTHFSPPLRRLNSGRNLVELQSVSFVPSFAKNAMPAGSW